MLVAQELWVTVGRHTVLADVSLRLSPGEVVAVVGPNGAGKSTLLKALCGDLTPTRGEVLLEGQRLSAWAQRARAQVMAVLPQDSTLVFPFTALEVVLMGRTPHLRGYETARDDDIAHLALETVGMAHCAHRLYPTLSGGECQRVQLARILAQVWETPPTGARYLLLDEPTASLDLAHQHRTLTTAQGFAHAGAGVLAIVHDLNLAAQYAERIVVLHRGRPLASGRPADVLTPEIIQTAFAVSALVLPHPTLGCPLVVPTQPQQTDPRRAVQMTPSSS
jgi:iron complex transport system ATP-binding protein